MELQGRKELQKNYARIKSGAERTGMAIPSSPWTLNKPTFFIVLKSWPEQDP